MASLLGNETERKKIKERGGYKEITYGATADVGGSRYAIENGGVSPYTIENEGSSRECWKVRHTLALLGCLGMSVMYAIRVCLSVTIVAMVGAGTGTANITANLSEGVCPRPQEGTPTISTPTIPHQNPDFSWDERTQGLVLGSFYWGYAATNIVGGRASEYLGGRLVFGLGVMLTSAVTLIGPVCARTSLELFLASRVLAGAMQGLSFPAVNTILATWVPPDVKSKYTTIVFGGLQIGTLISMPLSGWLSSTTFMGGWPSVFYVFGTAGMVWSAMWFSLVHDRPETHPRISRGELKQIQAYQDYVKGAKVVPIPWKALFTSLPFWSVLVASLGDDLGFSTLLSDIPTYLKNIQHFDLSSNGLISALPFVTMWVIGIIWAVVMDYMTSRKILSVTSVRRLSMCVGMFGPALSLTAMCFVNCNSTLAVIVLCFAVGFNGAVNSGHLCSGQDLAPNLAGTLLGITNTASAISGIVAPVVSGFIVDGNETLAGWRSVFLISAGVYIITNLFYIIFITAEVQPWNDPSYLGKSDRKRSNAEAV